MSRPFKQCRVVNQLIGGTAAALYGDIGLPGARGRSGGRHSNMDLFIVCIASHSCHLAPGKAGAPGAPGTPGYRGMPGDMVDRYIIHSVMINVCIRSLYSQS
jgi:hypothetical protein